MRLCDSEKCHGCILHHNAAKGRSMLFVFQGDKDVPSHVIKMYEKDAKNKAAQEVLKAIRSSQDDFLKDSVPRLLKEESSGGYRMVHEEYIGFPFMQSRAESRHLFWEKRFGEDLALMVRWLGHFYRSFSSRETTTIPAQKFRAAHQAVEGFCGWPVLDSPGRDIEVHTTAVHANLSPSNIARLGDRIVVFDWDYLKPSGWPLFDLSDFILRYLHFHHRFQKGGLSLEPKALLRYLCLFSTRHTPLMKMIDGYVRQYCRDVGLGEEERNVLSLLWLYSQFTHNQDVG